MSYCLKQDTWQKSYTAVLLIGTPIPDNQVRADTLFSEERVEFHLTTDLQLALEVLIFFWS